MKRLPRAWEAALIALLLVWLGVSTLAQTPVSEFEQALRAIPVSDIHRCVAAIELGLSQPDFPAAEVLQLNDSQRRRIPLRRRMRSSSTS